MQLHRLRLLNFRQHADTDITLGAGITAIIGPNGAGKTTLLEAIAWAFYGTPAVRGSRDGIRWNRAPARSSVRVDVEFTLGAHGYRVTRGLYDAQLFQDGSGDPVADSAQTVTNWIQRLLGMSRDEFFNTYFTGQKELAVMAAMGPTERGRFLSRVMGYEKLRLAQDRLRDARSGLRGELAGLEQTMGDPAQFERERAEAIERRDVAASAVASAEAVQAEAARALEGEGPAWQSVRERKERAARLDADLRLARHEVDEARRTFERLDKELAEALAARTELEGLKGPLKELPPLREELERLEHEARGASRRRELTGQLREVRAQHERVTARRDGLVAAEAALKEAEASARQAREELERRKAAHEKLHTEWVRARSEAETKRQNLREQYRDLNAHRERIVAAGADGACPTCARPLGAEYEGVLATLARQLEEIEVNGTYFRQRFEQLSSEPADVADARRGVEESTAADEKAHEDLAAARSRLEEVRDAVRESSRLVERIAVMEKEIADLPDRYDADRHDQVRSRLRELDPLVARAAALTARAERAVALVGEAEKAERESSAREARAAELSAALAELEYREDQFEEIRQRYEGLERTAREAERSVLERRGDLKGAESAVEAAERRLADRAERMSRAQVVKLELRLHDELDTAFHDTRTELNAQLRPELAEAASAFLSDLTDGRYHEIDLDEQYRIMVLEDGAGKPVISGGEEDITNLVLRLAISQLVAERAGQPLSLLVLDEIFGSLDESRRDHVVALLRRIGDRFPQVILITHIESVRDSVDRVLRVSLDAARGAAVVTEDSGGLDEDVAA